MRKPEPQPPAEPQGSTGAMLYRRQVPCCERDHNRDGDCYRHPFGRFVEVAPSPGLTPAMLSEEDWDNLHWLRGCAKDLDAMGVETCELQAKAIAWADALLTPAE